MKKKLLMLAPVLILGTGLVVGGSTFALFSANASNSGNTFAAGTLNISLDKEDPSGQAYFNVTNMAPGDSQVEPVTISSTGSLALYYTMSVTLGGFLATHDSNHLTYAVYTDSACTNQVDLTQPRALDAKGGQHYQETLYVKITLPSAANDDYENQSGTATITVNAVQQANNAQGGKPPTPYGISLSNSSFGIIYDVNHFGGEVFCKVILNDANGNPITDVPRSAFNLFELFPGYAPFDLGDLINSSGYPYAIYTAANGVYTWAIPGAADNSSSPGRAFQMQIGNVTFTVPVVPTYVADNPDGMDPFSPNTPVPNMVNGVIQ